MVRLTALFGLFLVAGAAPAQSLPTPAPVLDRARLESYVRHLLLWGPHIKVTVSDPAPSPLPGLFQVTFTASYQQASQAEVFYVSAGGRTIVRGAVYETDRPPFSAELAKLHTAGEPGLGEPGAKLDAVVFSDFQCSFCKEEARTLRENLLKAYPGAVRLTFKDFPLEQIHPWSKLAAIAGRCVFRQKAAEFWNYHDWIFEHQAEITPENVKQKVAGWAQSRTLDALQFSRCLDTRATEADVDRSIAEGRALRVSSTPTLFINGRPLAGNIAWNQLKPILDLELDFTKISYSQSEKCCELTLPVPGKK